MILLLRHPWLCSSTLSSTTFSCLCLCYSCGSLRLVFSLGVVPLKSGLEFLFSFLDACLLCMHTSQAVFLLLHASRAFFIFSSCLSFSLLVSLTLRTPFWHHSSRGWFLFMSFFRSLIARIANLNPCGSHGLDFPFHEYHFVRVSMATRPMTFTTTSFTIHSFSIIVYPVMEFGFFPSLLGHVKCFFPRSC